MNNKTPGRVAIYARISEDRESDERGVDRQIEDCRAKAAALGLEVIEPPFVDNDISASERSTKARPQYEAMLERARMGEFGTILAYSNSRLTRRPLEFEALIKLSASHGTVIRTVVSGDDDLATADGQFVARVKAAADAAEAARIAERVKRAVDQRKKLGEYHGSSAPFGYRIVLQKDRASVGADLVSDDVEVSMIREAVTRLLDAHDSLYSIVRDWNAAGRRTRSGTPWRHGVLRKALTNPALVARTRPIVDRARRAPQALVGYPARWEPILDDDTFAALTRRLIDPTRFQSNPTGSRASKYSLAGGLTVCGRCGKSLYGQIRKGKPAKLLCKASVNDTHENHPIDPETGFSTGRVSVALDVLEECVFEQFIERLNNNDYWNAHKHDSDPAASEKIAEAERLREAEQAKIHRAEEQAFDGLIDPVRLREMIERSRERIRELDAQIADLNGKPTARDSVITAFGTPEWILEQWPVFPPDAKRTLLKFMVEKVVINDYPEDLPKTASVRSGESREAFEARRRELWREAMHRRMVIHWRE